MQRWSKSINLFFGFKPKEKPFFVTWCLGGYLLVLKVTQRLSVKMSFLVSLCLSGYLCCLCYFPSIASRV